MDHRNYKKGQRDHRTKGQERNQNDHDSDGDSNKGFELVYGKNPVLEVMENSSVQVNKIWISTSLRDNEIKNRVMDFARERKVQYALVPESKLNSLTKNKPHQGLVLSISPINYLSVSDVIKKTLEGKGEKIILIAHEIEDNHNLGAMIRTFTAGGGSGVILTGKSHVGVNATTIKTSAGTLFQCNFARVTNCVNVLNQLKEHGFWILGAENSEDSESIYKISLPEQVAVLMGNEHSGFGPLIQKNCDYLAKIPISDKVDSLNVSVAFGVILFEVLRKNLK